VKSPGAETDDDSPKETKQMKTNETCQIRMTAATPMDMMDKSWIVGGLKTVRRQ
jgi:hypothetical protein